MARDAPAGQKAGLIAARRTGLLVSPHRTRQHLDASDAVNYRGVPRARTSTTLKRLVSRAVELEWGWDIGQWARGWARLCTSSMQILSTNGCCMLHVDIACLLINLL